MESTQHIKSGTSAAEVMPLLRDVLKAKLFVAGRIAKPIFQDSLRNGVLDPIASIAVLYIDNKPVAWTVRTEESWRTGVDDSEPRTEDEMYWRFTSPEYRNQGFYTMLKHAVNS
jgi:hypothetical protein